MMNITKIRLSLDDFVRLKLKHGRLVCYTEVEGGEWKSWKKEFGMPLDFHALQFNDGTIWDEVNGVRKDAS